MFIRDDYIPDMEYEDELEEEYAYYQDIIEDNKRREQDLSWLYDEEDDEEWRDIPGYEEMYQVSNKGRVKSLAREVSRKGKGGNYFLPERILSPSINVQTGYPMVNLLKECKRKSITIHSLVAKTFIPNPENKKCVNHIDTNRENNIVENLEWVTPKENSNHDFTLYKMSIANKGKPIPNMASLHTKEAIEKMKKSLTGRTIPEETRKKISEAKKGYKRSKESVEKMLKTREEKGISFNTNGGKHKVIDNPNTGKYHYEY